MPEVDSALLLRIDAFLGLIALALVVASFALAAVNLVVGLVCLLVVVLTIVRALKGYRRGYDSPDASEDTGGIL